MRLSIMMLVVVGIVAGGCQSTTGNAGAKQQGGTVLGAAAGALAGAQFGKGKGQIAAVAAGTLLGALVGSSVGESLDNADKLMMQQTTHNALETGRTGQSYSWKNPDTGHTGQVVPTKTWQESSGKYCREFQQSIVVGGQKQDAYGVACRQVDGTWKIVA